MLYRPISVLLPVYSKTRYKEFCKSIDSISFYQKNLPAEIIILIDGPVDQRIFQYVREIKKKIYKCKFKLFKFPTNKGLGVVLNYGVKFSTYELILRCDSDDYSDKNRIKLLYNFFKNNKKYSVIDSCLKENFNNRSYFRNFKNEEKNNFFSFKFRNKINHPTTLIKKQDVLKVGNYENVPFFEDYYLWIKLLKRKYSFSNINLPLVHTNINHDFFTRRSGIEYLNNYIFFLKKCKKICYLNRFELILLVLLRSFIILNHSKIIINFYKFFLRKKIKKC